MRLKFLYLVVVALFAVVFAACNAIDHKVNSQSPNANATSTQHADGVRRITIEQFEKLLKDGKAFIVDVRTQDAYDAGHIPGARLIPVGEVANHLKELPRDKTIVTYCS